MDGEKLSSALKPGLVTNGSREPELLEGAASKWSGNKENQLPQHFRISTPKIMVFILSQLDHFLVQAAKDHFTQPFHFHSSLSYFIDSKPGRRTVATMGASAQILCYSDQNEVVSYHAILTSHMQVRQFQIRYPLCNR